jgi:hypothetical protein
MGWSVSVRKEWNTRFTVRSTLSAWLLYDLQGCRRLSCQLTRKRTAEVPQTHRREIQAIFPDQDFTDMLIVPTCQKTVVDLVNRGEKVEQEKDYCLERFVQWAVAVSEGVSKAGYWVDYIDPSSGLPVCCRLS